MNKLIGQLMLIGISGPSLTQDEKKFITENNISGVVLFARNLVEPKQIHALCAEIQSLRHSMPDKAPLIIGIDMEGGRVHRLKPPFTQWPPLKLVGDLDAPTVAFYFANRMGLELQSVGINLDFAPCVDIFTNPKNTVIGDRALSSDPLVVEKLASALVRGYIKADVINCVKHFPGHGNTLIDSHEDLPVEDRTRQQLDEVELLPFKRTFRAKADMVMTGHLRFPNIDPEWPVTLSEIFLKEMLREELKFKGIIITDDLDMKALAKHYDKKMIPVRSFQAGADMLLYCNEPESPPLAIEAVAAAMETKSLDKNHLELLKQKILAFKKIKIPQPDPMPFSDSLKIIGNPDHMRVAESIRKQIMPEGLIAE